MSDLMDMMLHLADENAAEFKRRRWGLRECRRVMTLADVELQEWAAFKARLASRSRLLEKGTTAATFANVDIDEDDSDMLLSMLGALERAKDSAGLSALTVSEIVRQMQQDRVLSMEFIAAARAQTVRLLSKLREMNRVYQDQHGRWALL